jgi:hypothetical protein
MEAKPQFEPEGEGITAETSPTAPTIDTSERTIAPLRILPTDPSGPFCKASDSHVLRLQQRLQQTDITVPSQDDKSG